MIGQRKKEKQPGGNGGKMKETRIVYLLLGFALAWAITATYMLRCKVSDRVYQIVSEYIQSGDYDRDMKLIIESKVYQALETIQTKE